MNAESDLHLRRAKELLQVAEENLHNGHFADSVSRAQATGFRLQATGT